MIGKCRSCKRMVSHDEARCPYCDAERPVERPWELARDRRARPWPRALRRWGWVVVVSLALILVVSFCSAGAAAAVHP